MHYLMVAQTRSGIEPAEPTVDDDGGRLLERHRAGDPGAFDHLMRRYRAPIYGFFRRSGATPEVADDLFQETFLRVHAHAASYSATRPFKVWLFTIAQNLLRSHWRKAAVRRFLVGWWAGAPAEVPDDKAGPDELVQTQASLRWLEQALQQLPEKHRQALVLTQVEGLTMEEAAEVLAVPAATVKTWVHRGRLALVAARKRHEGDAS